VDFCATSHRKNPDYPAPYAVCRVKNRLIGDFLVFYTRSAANRSGNEDGKSGENTGT
jgi:hypothetical protein